MSRIPKYIIIDLHNIGTKAAKALKSVTNEGLVSYAALSGKLIMGRHDVNKRTLRRILVEDLCSQDEG